VADADQWLAAAGGAPLLARDLAQSGSQPCPEWLSSLAEALASGGAEAGQWADQIEKQAPETWIDALQRLFVDLLLAASGAPVRYFPALQAQAGKIAAHASRQRLGEAARWLAQQRAIAGHPLNAKLFAHSALQRIVAACSPQ
jgi:DNA polymerase-3 subunit delta'